jgi:hypothetical protein
VADQQQFRERLRVHFRRQGVSASDLMYKTFLGLLSSRVDVVEAGQPDKSILTSIRARISEATISAIDWDVVYQIERDILLAGSRPLLQQRASELLHLVEIKLLPRAGQLRTSFDALFGSGTVTATASPPSEEQVQNLALSILEEVQWDARKKYLAIPLRRTAMHRVLWASLLSFSLFAMPYLAILLFPAFFLQDIQSSAGMILWTVLTSGLMGAFFFRLIDTQGKIERLTLEELESSMSWRSVFLRGAVGMLGALVVFFLLRSNLVEGRFVPKMDQLGLGSSFPPGIQEGPGNFKPAFPTSELALLVIWCLLAGYSERIVPEFLSSTEGRFLSGKKDPGETSASK